MFIRQFLHDSWQFFQIQIPGTNITFAVLAICLALFNIGFSVLSMLLGVSLPNLGDVVKSKERFDKAKGQYGNARATRYHETPGRELDVR